MRWLSPRRPPSPAGPDGGHHERGRDLDAAARIASHRRPQTALEDWAADTRYMSAAETLNGGAFGVRHEVVTFFIFTFRQLTTPGAQGGGIPNVPPTIPPTHNLPCPPGLRVLCGHRQQACAENEGQVAGHKSGGLPTLLVGIRPPVPRKSTHYEGRRPV